MLALSIAGAAAAGIGKIVQASQARRAARRNAERQRVTLGETYEAGQDEISRFMDQGEHALATGEVSAASSGLKTAGGTMDLIRGESRRGLESDVGKLRDQNELNYTRGMEQTSLDMKAANQQATGAILGAVGDMAGSAASIYSQGVNSGKWTPGKDIRGRRRLNLPSSNPTNASYNPLHGQWSPGGVTRR